MKAPVTLLSALALAGCAGASTTPQLEARVSAVERELAAAPRPCAQVMDASVPGDTAFPFVVAYDVGPRDTRAGDVITITEVRGTSPALTVGGMYLVRGTYTLASAPDATLGLHVTAAQSSEGCSKGNGREHQAVARGSGSFELAARVPYDGRPHVSFYVAGQGSGGVYFDAPPAGASR